MKEIQVEISTPKFELAEKLAEYSWRERREINSAARHLRKFYKLTSREITNEEETDQTLEELEEEK